MAFVHIAVLFTVLVTMLGVPCAVTVVRRADVQTRRRGWAPDPAVTKAYRDLDLAMHGGGHHQAGDLDQIAHELRELNERRFDRLNDERPFWLDRAYDTKLCLACHCLGVQEHLTPLQGMDRELERVRVESVLEAAGVTLR